VNGLRAFFIACLALSAGLLVAAGGGLLAARSLPSAAADGMGLWRARGCEGCHALYGQGGVYASDLTGVVARRGPAALRRLLAASAAITAGGRAMPPLELAPAEVEALLAFLAWVGEQPPGNAWPPPGAR